MELWKVIPGKNPDPACPDHAVNFPEHFSGVSAPAIVPFLPKEKKTDMAVLIFPGGAYAFRADHEGSVYAEALAADGIPCFVVEYRVEPHRFPFPLLDARRAVQVVRAHASEYGIDPDKIVAMGSSAGGHLAAMLSTCHLPPFFLPDRDEIDELPSYPNATVLCYPVILSPELPEDRESRERLGLDGSDRAHAGSYRNLFGTEDPYACMICSPIPYVNDNTPPAFLWHTAEDDTVNVINSLRYAEALRDHHIPVELHVFPHGPHGLGLKYAREQFPHTAQWYPLLLNWFRDLGWL